MSERAAPSRVPDHVVWTGDTARVAIVDLSRLDQAPVLLLGDTALIWTWLAAGGAGTPDVEPDELEATLCELTRLGLLEPGGPDVPRDTAPVVDSLSPDAAPAAARRRGKSQ